MSSHARKGKCARQREATRKLLSRVECNLGKDREVVTWHGDIDGVKMSDVLEHFVEPYMRFTSNLASVEKLYLTAVIAWNMALFPKAERQQHWNQISTELKLDATSIADMQAIVTELVERKDRFFSSYRRTILDFEITDTGKDVTLRSKIGQPSSAKQSQSSSPKQGQLSSPKQGRLSSANGSQ